MKKIEPVKNPIMNNIPKIIHMTWKTKDILDSQSPLILNGLRNLIDLNPDWQVELSDDQDVDMYLKNMLIKKEYNLIKDEHVVVKSDVWRLIKLYNEGGLYIDLDRFCNISFSDILTDKIKCVLPTHLDIDFSHDFMMSEKNNPIYLETLNLCMQRRKEGHTNVYFLGPQTYMHGVTKVLTGEIINTNPGKEVFERIRKIIKKTPFIKTYRENFPYDTIIYKHDENKFKMGNSTTSDWETIKREFYRQNNVKHWTGLW